MVLAMAEKIPPKVARSRTPGPFGTNLRRRRDDAGLTQEELAAKAGISRGTIANLETGAAKSPDAETVEALAEAFGLSRGALWQDAGESSSGDEASRLEPPDAAQRGLAMTIEAFIARHGDDLTGRERLTLMDMARARPGTVLLWTEEDWIAWARSIRRRLGKDL